VYDSDGGGMPTGVAAIFILNLEHELIELQRSLRILSPLATGYAGNFIADSIHVLNPK
jgi:hypothetical protein